MPITAKTERLNAYLRQYGLLLCNESRELPSLSSVGGDWNAIVRLMTAGQAFYSKFYKHRVTYLSREYYAHIKPYKQRLCKVSPAAKSIYAFLSSVGQASTADIANTLMLPGKALSAAMDELFAELLVTVIAQDRAINISWSSFLWGTYETWEQLHPIADISASPARLTALTGELISAKQLKNLLK